MKRIEPKDAGIVALLDEARKGPLILRSEARGDFALLALDDDVIDLLLERSPRLIKECRQIRERMKQGEYHTHEEVLHLLELEPSEAEPQD